jgi:tetratricopeptide (TPR) repeat protein
LALENGRAGKYSAFQPELAAWGLGIALRGQREFAQAADAFDLVGSARDADPSLLDRASVAAGEMYDVLGLREQAVARYHKALDSGREGDSQAEARKHLRHPFQLTQQPAS